MLANNSSTSTCFAIFELIKATCFASTLSYPQKEFLNPHPQQVQPAPSPPRSKFNPHRTRTQSSPGPRKPRTPAG